MQDTTAIICTFRFLCDKQWNDLSEISGKEGVRYCEDCTKPVFLCGSYAELADHASKSHCIALRENEDHFLLGDVSL